MDNTITHEKYIQEFSQQVKKRSDQMMNYFLLGLFVIGILLAFYYDTWFIAIGVGGLSCVAYYSSKLMLPDSNFYQYVLSVVLGVFMAQFIYQMHGMFEMHFFAFIGSAILITYQNWKLQLPLTLFVVLHHAILAYLQFSGVEQVYFTQLDYMSLQTFLIHGVLAAIIFFLCGLWAYNFKKQSLSHIQQSFEIGKLLEENKQKEALMFERRLGEEAKEKSEKRYRQIVETAQEGIWMLDENNITTFVNKKMCEILGYLPEEIIGKESFYFMGEEAKRQATAAIEKRKQGVKASYELSFISKSGKTVLTHLSTNAILGEQGEFKGSLAMVIDITEKRLAEEKIIQTEHLLSESQQIAKVGNWNFDVIKNEIYWSDGLRNITGIDNDFIPSLEAFIAVIHPKDVKRVAGEIMQTQKTGNLLENWYRIIRVNDQEERIIHSIIRTTKGADGKLSRIYGVSQDVTELKQAQTKLELTLKDLELRVEERTRDLFISREYFSKTLQSLGDAVISTDASGNIIFMNNAAEYLTGKNIDEANGKPIEFACNMLDEHTLMPIENPIRIALKKNKVFFLPEHALLFKEDKTCHYIDDSAAPIHNDKNEIVGAVLIFRDVSEKAMNLKNLKDAHREIEEKNKSIMDSIQYAKRIQEAMLPRLGLLSNVFPESFVVYKPKDIVSGDFYWIGQKGNKFIIATADCTGHGVPGAFMSMIGYSLLNEIVYRNNIIQPSEILKKLNNGVRSFLHTDSVAQDGMDISICSIDRITNKLNFSGANRPLIHFKKEGLDIIKGNKYGVGGLQFEDEREYTNHEILFNKEDSIYMFTDGIVDQFGGENAKKMMSANFINLLKSKQSLKMPEQKQVLTQYFEEWQGKLEQTDDVLLIGVKLDL